MWKIRIDKNQRFPVKEEEGAEKHLRFDWPECRLLYSLLSAAGNYWKMLVVFLLVFAG